MTAKPPLEAGGFARSYRVFRLAAVLQAAKAVRWIAHRMRRRPYARMTEWAPGISVVIIERAGPPMLEETLASVVRAGAAVDEPVEIVVVVNGGPPADYRALTNEYPGVRWVLAPSPLAYDAAVKLGVAEAQYDGVYLLGDGMRLNEDSFAKLVPWRAPNVFAIASQRFLVNATRHIEDNGWTDFRLGEARVELVDPDLEGDGMVRGHLYARGAGSLFRRQTLCRLQERGDAYGPFAGDAEWGVRAWREGYESLFCPASKVSYRGRGNVTRFFDQGEVARVAARNEMQFALRNLLGAVTMADVLAIARDPERCSDLTLRELTSVRSSAAIVAAQWDAARAPYRDVDLRTVRRKFYPTPFPASAGKPVLVLASPYAIYPPAHGGAMRISEILRVVAQRYRVIVLGDEQQLYGAKSVPFFAGLHAVHLVGGRPKEHPDDVGKRIPRILNHTHRNLREELRRLIAAWQPEVVQIEYVELAAAIEERHDDAAWFLTLHDVLLDPVAPTDADRFEKSLIERYDATIVCSDEDATLVQGMHVEVVPNGTRMAEHAYEPSRGNTTIVFAGPFRYPPNLDGVRRFLETVYPQLELSVPQLELIVLGGRGAPDMASGIASFAQPGVKVMDFVQDVERYLSSAAATINPLQDIRGSSLKLIESLAAGRVCVSTTDGARGFLEAAHPSLIVVDRIEDFLAPLERLLLDEPYRLELERPTPELLNAYSWQHSAELLLDVYARHRGPPA